MVSILFVAINAHAFGIGVKLTHNLGNVHFKYEDMSDLLNMKKYGFVSGLVHSFGIGAFLDTNVEGESWFGYRFSAEVLYANSCRAAALSLVRFHFNNMPHFRLYQNYLIRLWIGPMISFGGIYSVHTSKSYILIFPNFYDFNNGFASPFKIKIKHFYFNAGGAVGININLKNSNTLTIEVGARIGVGPASNARVPYTAGHISAMYTTVEGYISCGYLYRIIDTSREKTSL